METHLEGRRKMGVALSQMVQNIMYSGTSTTNEYAVSLWDTK